MNAIPTLDDVLDNNTAAPVADTVTPMVSEEPATDIIPIQNKAPTLDDVLASDNIVGKSNLDDFNVSDAPIDGAAWLAQWKRTQLDNTSSEFGTAQDDRNEPRIGTTGFWQSLLPRGTGKNTVSDFNNLENWGHKTFGREELVGPNDADQLLEKVYRLQKERPDLMQTDEGKALIEDIKFRVDAAATQNQMGFQELGGMMLDYASDDPGGFAELALDEIAYNPLLIPLTAIAYSRGSALAQGTANAIRLTKVINLLRMGTARQRLAAFAISNTANAIGIGTTEAGINVAYQQSANAAAGREPMHNTVTVAQLGLAVGVTGGLLRGAYRLINGDAAVRASANKVAHVQGYRDFNHLMDDLAVKSGWEPAEIIKNWKENMNELPFLEFVDSVMKNKVADIANEVPASTPRSPRYVTPADVETIFKDIDGVGTLSEKIGKTDPAGVDSSGNPFYNIKSTIEDLKNGVTWLRGLNKDGTRATGEGARVRQNIFNKYDDVKLTQWLQRKGVKGYTELLQRIEANRLKMEKQGSTLDSGEIYRRAVNKSFDEMGVQPSLFKKISAGDKIRESIRATFTQAGKDAIEVVKNPRLLYTPIRDTFIDSARFADEIIHGPKEGYKAAAKQRDNISNMLRDWEGNRLSGEMDVKLFTDWIKREVPDAQKREAMSHFLEGERELSRYNEYRIRNGQEPIQLSDYEKQIASNARKYFDDILNWAQKSELFTLFRDNPSMYKGAKRMAGDTSVDTRSKVPDAELWDFVNASTDPRGMMWKVSGEENAMGYYQNYVPHLIKREFAPTDKTLYEWTLDDAHKAGQLQTRSAHLKERSYETLMDAIDAGETVYTRDIAHLAQVYGKSMLRAQVNARLLRQLKKMKNVDGKPMLTSKADAPDHYVEFKHPNFKGPDNEYMYVNPNLAPDLRLYFDTNDPNVANRILQNIVLIAKRGALGLSFFHIAALGWSGLVAGQGLGSVLKDVLPLNSSKLPARFRMNSRGALALTGRNGRDADYLAMGMRNGLGLGVLEELKGDTLINGMRSLANWTEINIENNKYFKPLGKPLGYSVSKGIRGVARAQEIIDSHLWDHVNSGLKATTFLTTMEKMVLQDAKRVNSGAQAELSDMNAIAQRAAQFTNDAYGNQNWAQMAMNVENFMGHRVAAAMNKPSMRGYIRMLIFAPDWSLSNLRVLGKTVSGAVPFGKAELAHREYAKYALRSAILFAFVNEVLQVTSGQPSIFEESGNDLLYADLGDGKKLQASKQLAEVLSLFTGRGPAGVIEHKLSAPVKAYQNADSASEFVGNMLGAAVPIGVKQTLEGGTMAGSLGFPYYDENNR